MKVTRKTVMLNSALCVAVLGVGFGGWSVLHGDSTSKTSTKTTATVQKGVVQQSVTATGNLAAITQLDVSFDTAVASNLVTDIMVKVGDKVTKGQPLAKVDDRLVQATLASATASMTVAQSNYDKAKAGLTPEDRAQLDAQEAQSLASVGSAQTSVDNAKATADQNVITQAENVRQAQLALTNAQAQADRDVATAQSAVDQARANYDPLKTARDAAREKRDADQAALDASNVLLATYTADNQYCLANPSAITALDGVSCASLAGLITTTTTDRNTKQTNLAASQAALDKADASLIAAANAVTNASNSFESTKLKAKQSVDNATNSVINAQNSQASGALKDQQSIVSAQRQYDSAFASYQSTLAANAIKKKPPTAADIAAQEVSLINASNSLATAQKNAAAAVIVAPSAGTVAIINGKLGSAGSATSTTTTGTGGGGSSSTPFLTLTDPSAFEVKVGFSEADAAKVKAAQTATVTVDAVNARLTGTVRSIDTTSTLVSNVVTYYAYLSITQIPANVTVQAGMTASVSVAVQRLTDVLMLPTASVSSRGTTATVQVQSKTNPKKTEARDITIGLRGDTALEILTGLNEGDVVVTTRTAVSTAQATQTNTGVLTGTGTQTGVGGVGVGGVGVGGVGVGGVGAGGGGANGRTGATGAGR
jgi:multidrug efflux pump subunit AcrA (membrane-fusion protein)